MHEDYADIRKRINEPPAWYDSNGVPRYAPFTPTMCPDIYARTVVLLEIACQACGEKFQVELHYGPFDRHSQPKQLHYGDPPRHECPGAGESMNCEDLRVLEVWHYDYDKVLKWVRHPELEGPIEEDDPMEAARKA